MNNHRNVCESGVSSEALKLKKKQLFYVLYSRNSCSKILAINYHKYRNIRLSYKVISSKIMVANSSAKVYLKDYYRSINFGTIL